MNRKDIEFRTFKRSAIISVSIVLFLWLIKGLEIVFDTDLGFLGIYPKTLLGFMGILTSAFVHGSVEHLLSNSFTLLVLVFGLYFFYRRKGTEILLLIAVVSQFWVWMIGRPAYHIGASGVIYGLFGFILFSGLIRKQRAHLALSAAVLFLYGGMLAGIAPTETHISWESHLMGFIAGIFFAFYYRDIPLFGIIVKGWDMAEENDEGSNNISTTFSNPYITFNYVSEDEEEFREDIDEKNESAQ